jgi:hypothetical protein
LDVTHTIFRTPHAVELKLEDKPVPEGYRRYFDGDALGATLPMWQVHAKPATVNVGLVSDGYRFADSPDAEFIAGGVNSKNVGALALGRQGNWFLWGFCGDPDEMVDAARLTFVNTVVYMRGFDGKPALVGKTSHAREWALNYPRFYTKPEQRSSLERSFSAPLLEVRDRAPEQFIAFLREHLDWLYCKKATVTMKRPDGTESTMEADQYWLDDDAKALGIANHDPRLLERCIGDLGGDAEAKARALRVLARYAPADAVERHADDAAAWRKWFDAVAPRLFFSDAGGYRFGVAEPAAKKSAAVQVEGAEPDDVVTAVATLEADTLVVTVTVRPGFHVYPPGSQDGDPIRLTAAADSAFVADGGMRITPGDSELHGTFTIRQKLKRKNGVDGGALHFEFYSQACDPMACLPGTTVAIRTRP